jgi:hypothetical protein
MRRLRWSPSGLAVPQGNRLDQALLLIRQDHRDESARDPRRDVGGRTDSERRHLRRDQVKAFDKRKDLAVIQIANFGLPAISFKLAS